MVHCMNELRRRLREKHPLVLYVAPKYIGQSYLLRMILATAWTTLTPMTITPKQTHRYAGIFSRREALLSLI
jgi:hypothetical protein